MQTITYKKGLRIELENNCVLEVHKYKYRYYASVLDKTKLTIEHSKDYNTLKGLNNFLKKYDVELV